jgi:diguanylate cyclase (GGDEF)-like protein/PAS domain S-box-containing protein
MKARPLTGKSSDLRPQSAYPARLAGDVSTLNLRLAALLELGVTLLSERTPQGLLELFCNATQEIMHARLVAISLGGGERPRHIASRNIEQHDLDALVNFLGLESAILRNLLVSGMPLRAGDLQGSPMAGKLPPLFERQFLVVPILGSQSSGWLYLADRPNGDGFDDADMQFGATLAAQLAPVFENLTLYQEVQQYAGRLELEIVERKRVAGKLHEREAGLQRAQIMTKSAHVVTGADGVFVSWSETLPQLLGVNDAGMPPTTRKWLDLVHPDDRARFRDVCITAGKQSVRLEVEYRLRRADSTWRQLRQVLEPLLEQPDSSGQIHWFNTIQDITDQKEQQEKIARLSRISTVLSGINSAIVRIHDREQLLQEACRVAVSLGELSMAWIGLIDPDTLDGTVAASAGGDAHDLEQIQLTARTDSPHRYLPACIALREMRSVICNDVRLDVMPASRGAALYERGHKSIAAWPLIVDNKAIGVLVLRASETGFFDEGEMKLLNELAGDLSFGLQFIEKEERLNYLAYYDALTGLPNRTLFLDRLSQYLLTPKSNGDVAAVVMMDLQHFAQLNDGLGRHTGDAIIRAVAGRVKRVLHEPCSLAHISGGAFAIAIPGLKHGTDAVSVLEQQVFETLLQPFIVGGREIRVAARAGIALWPTDGNDAESLFRHAEVALNKAKSLAEQYLFYAPQMNAAISARMALEDDLQEALNQRQFVIYYQPRVDISSGRIVGAEALIRWQHPVRGLVSPVEFIPLAEETGLIVPIGAWVIDEVCLQQAGWLAQGVQVVPVAVNLSTVQFKKGQVLQTINDCMKSHRIESHHIEFELTESMVMDDPEQGSRNLQALKKLGLKLSLDDFGTGYSSLAYLKRFPFDFVKIDRAFVTDITRSAEDAAIATAIIAMAHSLNLRVVAEGVETREQLEYLREHQCDELQGYYFSESLPAQEFEAMLRSGKRLQD